MTPFALPLLELGSKLIDRLVPGEGAQATARAELAQMAQTGELRELETRMSAILAEAQSADPWTSRARPSFLYVVYILILTALPMGVLSAFAPDIAARIATGAQQWLAAIPEPMWTLFGVGYLGYSAARSWDKRRPHDG